MQPYTLVTTTTPRGARAGLVVDGVVHDAAEATGRAEDATVRDMLQDWTAASDRLAAAADRLVGQPGSRLDEIELLPPLPGPGAILCTGSNYTCHAHAMERAAGLPPGPDPKALGLKPYCFLKISRCVAGPHVAVPLTGPKLDWEAELAVVIGRTASNVTVEDALDHVAGYTIANDLSARDRFARPQEEATSPFRFSWFNHKNFDASCPIGPALVPAQFVADPQDLAIRLWVNGVLKQDSNTGRMIFNIAEQIAEYSSRITLQPGDLILTGTPAGTGAEDGKFLASGDQVTLEIEGLGRLVHSIR